MSFLRRSTRHFLVVFTVSLLLLSHRTLAQNTPSAPAAEPTTAAPSLPAKSQTTTPKYHVETSISVSAMGQLTATRISDSGSNFVTQSLSPSAGVFATVQQSFTPWLGYSANFGYTRATYRETAAAASLGNDLAASYIPSNVYETSVSYIAQKHLTNRLTAFGEAGGGAVSFAAITRDVSSKGGTYLTVERSNTFRPVGIAGFGIDYRLEHGLVVRAEYRGLFVSYPDYASGRPGFSTLTSEPTMGVAYTFGRHAKN